MVDTNKGGPSGSSIPARSKRQAMDWSLVLASQEIAAIVNKTESGWVLLVDPPDLHRAQAALAQYQAENRGWRWQHHWPAGGVVFHWGSLLWVLAMAAIYFWSTVRFPWLRDAGMVDSKAIGAGQWWRLFTAITLHANLPHLIGNLSIGFVLLGLAMARYGPCIAVLAAFLAGAVGNCASVFFYPAPHDSLGASGMVTGALGLITVQIFTPRRKYPLRTRLLWRAGASGILLLALIGFSPGTDTAAHIGGFVAGAVFGLALGWVRPASLQKAAPNLACGIALAGWVFATWWLASRGT
jgi:membrane associated rhomboid family serine protease